jgi:hypothetical protein
MEHTCPARRPSVTWPQYIGAVEVQLHDNRGEICTSGHLGRWVAHIGEERRKSQGLVSVHVPPVRLGLPPHTDTLAQVGIRSPGAVEGVADEPKVGEGIKAAKNRRQVAA